MISQWRCPHCRTLLGIFHGQDLELRYKVVAYVVKNPTLVVATCRKCGNSVKSGK